MKKLALLALAAVSTTLQAAPPPSRPKLIVAISIDQFSSELYQRYRDTYTGGLKTLSRGVAFPVGYQSHAATETCPGHSTILTGRHPSGTGIVANLWIDRNTGKNVYCVSVPGAPDSANVRGPQNMKVTTLGDWVKAAAPGSRVFAVSGKDRAAITMAGQGPDAVYWWTDGIGFTTSSFAGPTAETVIAPADAYNRAKAAEWAKTPPTLWPQVSKRCEALQKPYRFGDMDISGKVPPEYAAHATDAADFQKTALFQNNLRSSPMFDSLVLEFTEQLIAREKLGQGPAIDVLAVSFSANDYVGHRFGNGGAEMCVHQEALDATLGRFLEDLKKLGVPMIVVLTADHGATDAAEREHDHDADASRLDGRKLMKGANAAVRQQLGLDFDPLDGDEQQIYLRTGADAALRDRVRAATIAWLKTQPKVSAVFTREEIEAAVVPPHTAPDKLTVIQRFNESYDRERSADLAVVFGPRMSYGIPKSVGDTVAGHGSPWDHDRQVPILFWWPGAKASTRATPAETVDIAPTLAAVAGITPPVPVDGQCLDLGGNCPK